MKQHGVVLCSSNYELYKEHEPERDVVPAADRAGGRSVFD